MTDATPAPKPPPKKKPAPEPPAWTGRETAASILAAKYPEGCRVEEERADPTVEVDAALWPVVARWLKEDAALAFETCHLVTGIDRGAEADRLEAVYSLYSRVRREWLHVRIPTGRAEGAEVPSAAGVWRAADWHERETFDLVGIHFTEHPDPRRIFLPDDWEGHPLRKDYDYPVEYHGIRDVYRMPGGILAPDADPPEGD